MVSPTPQGTPPKGTPIEKNTAIEFGISGAKFTSEINQTTSEVVETTWEIVGTASTADENVLFPRARIHYNKLFFAFYAINFHRPTPAVDDHFFRF